MKTIFLDIDGVLNSAWTLERERGTFGIDKKMAVIFKHILRSTGAKVVLSSSWRLHKEHREIVRKKVCRFIDCTPHMPLMGGAEQMERGKEIKAWLDKHPEVTSYAILDDDSDMLPDQPHFKTSFQSGLTKEIADNVIKFLNN